MFTILADVLSIATLQQPPRRTPPKTHDPQPRRILPRFGRKAD